MSTPTPPTAKKHITFDPTINAGHVLTFVTLVIAGFASWGLLDKRVTVIEQAQMYQRERDIAQDGAVVQKFGEVKEALTEVKQAVNELRRDQREKGKP